MLETNKVHHLNCIDGMKHLDAECVDLCITSPPYDNLRTYNDSSKWNFDTFKLVANELTKVLKPGGVIMWNVNDATINGSETGSSFRQCLYFHDECGLNIHDTMIYEKTGISFASGPKSVRYSQCFEQKTGELEVKEHKTKPIREYGARNNIWRIKNSGGFGQSNKQAYKHPATMPEDLARGHIQTWPNPRDLVIDPFMGSGTTAQVCIQDGRNFIGFEVDETYYNMCVERVATTTPTLLTSLGYYDNNNSVTIPLTTK